MSVVIRIDPSDLDVQRHGDRWSGALSVGLVQLGAAGEQYTLTVKDIEVSAPENYEPAMGDVVFRMRCDRDVRASFLRGAVIDKSRVRLGSLSMPLPK